MFVLLRRMLVIGFFLSFTVFVVYFIYGYCLFKRPVCFGQDAWDNEMRKYAPTDYRGDLGGMRVILPREYVEYVEYDGDPEFGERKKKRADRNGFEFSLKSFGVEISSRGLLCKEFGCLVSKRVLDSITQGGGVYIGVSAGSSYFGEGFLDRRARVIDDPENYPGDYWWNSYERAPLAVYGLESYTVSGVREDDDNYEEKVSLIKDVYIRRVVSGRIDTLIECRRKRVSHGVSSCNMVFSLEPEAQASLNVRFSTDLLPEWLEIRAASEQLILDFKVD